MKVQWDETLGGKIMSLRIHSGAYDRSKYKGLRVLESLSDQWVSSRAVILFSDCSFYSVARLLSRWAEWEYILRRPCLKWNSGDFEYKLAQRGKDWLNWAKQGLPNAPIFEAELQAWWKLTSPLAAQLLSGKFKDCVAFVNSHHSRIN
jgi:hypothetical protein